MSPAVLTPKPNLPISEAIRLIGISEATMRRHIRAGLVRVVRIGGRVLVPAAEIERLTTGE